MKRNTGYVGFGTDTPLTPIHINYQLGTTNAALRLVNGSAANASNITKIALFIANNTGGAEESAAIFAINPNAGANNGGDLVLATSLNGTATTATERMRINNAGLVGINTNSPEALLHINKSSAGGEGGFLFLDNSAGSTLGNKSGIRFANDAGASFSGYSSFIESINTDSGNGASALTFGTWNGSSRDERLRISAAGNVGIGITTPSYALDVVNSSNPSIRVRNGALGGTATLLLETPNNFSGTCQTYVKCIGAVGSGVSELSFGTAGASGDATATERMRITSGGNLLLATTTNGVGKLQIRTTGSDAIHVYQSSAGGYGLAIDAFYNAGTYYFQAFVAGVTDVGSITSNGTTTTYATTSDYRMKEDFKESKGLEKVSAINVYDFKYKDSENRMDGVIAHELQQIIPYAVVGEKDDEKMQGVDYSLLTPINTKAIQELYKLVLEQQAQIEELKAKIK